MELPDIQVSEGDTVEVCATVGNFSGSIVVSFMVTNITGERGGWRTVLYFIVSV